MKEDYKKIAQDSINKAIVRRRDTYSPLGSIYVTSVDIYSNFTAVRIDCAKGPIFITEYAKCNPVDPFKPETGITIAANRALERSLNGLSKRD